MSGEKVRSTPYLTSCAVTGVPSCHTTPLRRWKVHTVSPLLGVPVSVARSPTSLGWEPVSSHPVRVRTISWSMLEPSVV